MKFLLHFLLFAFALVFSQTLYAQDTPPPPPDPVVATNTPPVPPAPAAPSDPVPDPKATAPEATKRQRSRKPKADDKDEDEDAEPATVAQLRALLAKLQACTAPGMNARNAAFHIEQAIPWVAIWERAAAADTE